MAKYGLFEAGKAIPLAVYEGDFMETYTEQDLVKVMKNASNPQSNEVEVAVVKLRPGLIVREIP